jgi:hypothetical protein
MAAASVVCSYAWSPICPKHVTYVQHLAIYRSLTHFSDLIRAAASPGRIRPDCPKCRAKVLVRLASRKAVSPPRQSPARTPGPRVKLAKPGRCAPRRTPTNARAIARIANSTVSLRQGGCWRLAWATVVAIGRFPKPALPCRVCWHCMCLFSGSPHPVVPIADAAPHGPGAPAVRRTESVPRPDVA